MSVPDSELAGIAQRLEVLVAQRRYGEAQACFDEYSRDLQATLLRLPHGDPRFREIEEDWHKLIERTRRRVLTGRAHLAARLARLPRRRLSYSAARAPRRTWELLG